MNLESIFRRVRRRLAVLGSVALLGALASCGGGDLVNPFSPNRIVAFGDESSAITSSTDGNGKKYSVNFVDTSNSDAPQCGAYPSWTQYLANSFALPFRECITTGTVGPSVMRAAIGAKVADIATQIDQHLVSDQITNHDLVTLLVGANDILEQYQAYDAGAQDVATGQAVLQQRAVALVAQVTRLIGFGSKVLISTVPNLGFTPYAVIDQEALHPGQNRSGVLSTLSTTFNSALRTALVNFSGRDVGLVLSDEIVRLDVTYPDNYSLANVNAPMCLRPATADLVGNATAGDPNGTLTYCTNDPARLVSGANPSTWLWAGTFQLGPYATGQMGSEAYSRATNNPF